MNIVHIAPITLNKSSGISTVVPTIVSMQNRVDNVNAILINKKDLEATIHKKIIELIDFNYYDSSYCRPHNFQKLMSGFGKPDIVILHGVYNLKDIQLSTYLKKKKIPYVLFPHGGLTTEAQKISKYKKQIANVLFFNRVIANAEKIQYLSKGEAAHSAQWNKEYYISGNGIELPEISWPKEAVSQRENIEITFIGRLHIRTKGIDLLLETARISKEILMENNAKIRMYGPDSNGSIKEIMGYIKKYKLEQVIELHPPVYDEEKLRILKESDIFILLSRSEGLPTVVLEALSCGTPCLLTPGTNLAETVKLNKCGWKVGTTPKEISEKLQLIVENHSKDDIFRINSRKFIIKNYTWEIVTKKTLLEYKKIISNATNYK